MAYMIAFWSAVAFLIAGAWLVRRFWGAKASKLMAAIILLPTVVFGAVFSFDLARTFLDSCPYDSAGACRGLAVGWPLALAPTPLNLVPNTFALLKKPAVQAKG
jgi:hypothetical protein